jgi:lauroyl/myristoyl acyltransferase
MDLQSCYDCTSLMDEDVERVRKNMEKCIPENSAKIIKRIFYILKNMYTKILTYLIYNINNNK